MESQNEKVIRKRTVMVLVAFVESYACMQNADKTAVQ